MIKMKFVFYYIFIFSVAPLAGATSDLESGYHHIEPLLKEVEEVLQRVRHLNALTRQYQLVNIFLNSPRMKPGEVITKCPSS
jgi:hypothetical protein